MGQRLGIGLALATATLWGTLPIAAKVALAELGPFFISAARFVMAAGVLAVLMARFRGERLRELVRERPPWIVVPVAVALAGNYILYLLGLDRTTATAAQIVVQMSSVFLVVWGVTLFDEALTRRRVVGAAAAIVGVFVVTWNGEPLSRVIASRYMLGNVLVVLAALTWSLYAIGQKRLNEDYTSYQVLVMVYAVCAAVLLVPAVPEIPAPGQVPPLAWLALGYLGFNTLAAYGAFGEALKHAPASVVAVTITSTPLFTIAFVALVTRFLPGLIPPEEITLFTLGGAALVVVGVSLVALERHTGPEEVVA